jgi:hypothetical protein
MDYEKLGLFYLGTVDGEPWLYDSRDLLTHAVILGMTGSGKTGLGLTLLEEAAIDGIPSIVVDPKGDLADLALRLDPRDPAAWRPWVDPEAARRAGLDVEAFAAREAARWADGLAKAGQGPDRIERLREAASVAVFTPGSSAVRPLSVLASFARPPAEVLDDPDALRVRLATTAGSLVGLLGLDPDPVKSREHVLLSTLLERAWRSGRDLDLPSLIAAVAQPALDRIGALPLDTFFPPADRQKLAIQLNTLVASPSFAAWLEGEPLDVGSLLYADGKPRIAVLSIAHLGEAERMFFVALLLGQVLAWMRAQPGTTSNRAVVYMDEVAGYLPPVANPPSKLPFLTLLKQARAYGVSLVLATQNPVDLDYKALSNAGTWFVGRLQTERDRDRLLDGLASMGADRGALEARIAGLQNRRFVVHDVHADAPVEIESRWALSYLRGPLTTEELARLRPTRPVATPKATASAPTATALPQLFVPALAAGATYEPRLLGAFRVHVTDARLEIDHTEDRVWLLAVDDDDLTVDWARATPSTLDPERLEREAPAGASFAPVPAALGSAKGPPGWTRALVEAAYRTVRFELTRSRALGVVSRPGESADQLQARLLDRAREERDRQVQALRDKHAARLRALEERVAKARAAIAEQEAQATRQKVNAAVSFGATLFGAVFGTRGSTVNRAATAAKGVSSAFKESSDVDRAQGALDDAIAKRDELAAEIEAEVERIGTATDPVDLETVVVKPKKSDIEVRLLAVAWVPRA